VLLLLLTYGTPTISPKIIKKLGEEFCKVASKVHDPVSMTNTKTTSNIIQHPEVSRDNNNNNEEEDNLQDEGMNEGKGNDDEAGPSALARE
jgi:hypothetical protein